MKNGEENAAADSKVTQRHAESAAADSKVTQRHV